MPNYGLDQSDRGCEPWGLHRSVLEPGKVITDPVHGDIHLTRLEVAVIDSRPFQRLRRVRQLGNTHLVYPGAVHTRFSHSLGALKMAQTLLDIVWRQSSELNGVPEDLFAEWHAAKGTNAAKEWAQATVLARLGALLHDLCHVPAGHTVEDDLRVLTPHDENVDRFGTLWSELAESVPARLEQLVDKPELQAVREELLDVDGELHKELRPLIISKGEGTKDQSDMEYPFCADLVGNTICADLLDYLDRDHLFAGLPESLGRRFISAFFVTPSDRGPFSERLALNIVRGEHERTDIVSELLKALRYRYELSERALVHQAKLCGDAMLGESIERWEWDVWWRQARKKIPDRIEGIESEEFDPERIPKYRADLEKEDGRGRMDDKEWAQTELGRVAQKVRKKLEEKFQDLGDEALLDHLISLEGRPGDPATSSLRVTSAGLARDLRDRHLYRIAGRVGSGDVSPRHIYRDFGAPDVRADLETEAQRFAHLELGPRVILWIPRDGMRVKQADVLVRQQAGIAPFVTYEKSRSRRGTDIYDSHERLWAAYVFVHRSLKPEEERLVCAYLARRMGVRWEQQRHLLGDRPDQWPLRMAIADVFDVDYESGVDRELDRHEGELSKIAARKSGEESFRGLCDEVRRVKEQAEEGDPGS